MLRFKIERPGMTIRNLDVLLHPKSVALVGASARTGSVGQVILSNLLASGFPGPVYAINSHPIEMPGARWFPSIGQIPAAPDLAILAIPAEAVPVAIGELGALGTKAAVVVSAGITEANGLRQAMLDAAKPYLLRIVGPNCVGVQLPHAHLNGSFAHIAAAPNKLALISQSGALVTAILDWAANRGIGFSGVVSVGDMADVDLGDLIDLYATDPRTDAILMYVEGVTNPAKFMSAARAAARVKPVIAIKAGRSAAANRAVMSHTGALAGSYEVYETAFRRAGIIMVDTLTELFDAAEILGRTHSVGGERLAIVTNGGGGGVLAVDALNRTQGKLAVLSDTTMSILNAALPQNWSHANPVDVIGDAHADRYRAAVSAVLRDEGVDALLVMNCPTALSSSGEIAGAVADTIVAARAAGSHKPVFACWLGDTNCAAAQSTFADAGVPLCSTPEGAIRSFEFLLAAKQARLALLKAPMTGQPEQHHDRRAALGILKAARDDGRTVLNEIEAKALLRAYGVPVVPTELAVSVEAVGLACAKIAGPYAVKIISPQITHKSDVGGVALSLPDAGAAVTAAKAMHERISREHPEASIKGFAVETMSMRPHAHELIVGIADDPTFGPLLMVGAGGKAVEILNDKALELAPLDAESTRAMISRTRIAHLLNGYRDEPAANIEGVANVLEALSAMVIDLPDILELDINPLVVDAAGVIALDARVRITTEADPASRLVIRPVPVEWTADLVTRAGDTLHVRPVEPTDEDRLAEFFRHVTSEDLRFRFLTGVREVSHDRIAAMTQIDYRRTMTFLAFDEDRHMVVAVATLAADPDRVRAEVALTVRSDRKQHGISWTLLDHVVRYAKAEGISVIESLESASNAAAIGLEREMGFVSHACPGDPTVRIVRRVLSEPAAKLEPVV
jgi:acetyltransferase